VRGDVRFTVHGRRMLFNFGHPYPLFARLEPLYNAVLLETIAQVSKAEGRGLDVVDVGAGFGDTIAMVDANAPGAVRSATLVEPEPEFFRYLQTNLGDDPRVTLVNVALGRESAGTVGFSRHHPGTASATSEGGVPLRRLDEVVTASIDVLKVDTDGFDPLVIEGATALLATHRPAVVFEFHPVLADRCGNDPTLTFSTLAQHGYRTFALFDRAGAHSATLVDPSPELVTSLADRCRAMERLDHHFDVLALHPERHEDLLPSIVRLDVARERRSRW
jgi:FkbM family methyltransferase